jgi:polyphosphate kinase
MNSLSDEPVIRALCEAAQAGVKVRLNIRGVCCLKPGVPGLSAHITVVSIIDRFLEHARVFCFHDGGRNLVYIASADAMPRNLDKRIELMIPVLDARNRKRLLEALDVYFSDNRKAHLLTAKGSYRKIAPRKREAAVRSQHKLYTQAQDAARLKEQTKPTMLEPHHKQRK